MSREPRAPDEDAGEPKASRRPLAQRTALHALKTLVVKHPGAALDAAGSGAAYAAKSLLADGAAAVKSGVAKVAKRLAPEHEAPDAGRERALQGSPEAEPPEPNDEPDEAASQPVELTPEQTQDLAEALSDKELEALAALGRERPKD